MTDNFVTEAVKDGKRLGFQFKGTSKRQKIVESEKKTEVDIVTAIEGSTIDSMVPSKKDEVLIIPLIQPRALTTGSTQAAAKTPAIKVEPSSISSSKDSTTLTLDQIAAAELLAEIQNGDQDIKDPNNLLVIKQSATVEASPADQAGAKKKAPLLMLNVAPELLNIANESERFKYDVSSRAEDLNVRSEIYDAIPVGQFGAALLRGMGWAGPDKEEKNKKEEKIVAREHRLGLGAQAKPPDRPKSSKKDGAVEKLHSEQDARRNKDMKKWEARAEERLSGQRLQDEDMVWLRAPAELSGKRAVVVTAKGVPGLDRVRIQLEHSGRILEVGRKDCVLLSAGELEDTPFIFAKNHAEVRAEAQGRHQLTQYSGLKGDAAPAASNGNGSSRGSGGDSGDSRRGGANSSSSASSSSSNGGGDKLGDRSYERLSANESKQESYSSGDYKHSRREGSSSKAVNVPPPPPAPAVPVQQQQVYWLREGIRVKIVSRSIGGSKAYLQKGTVLDVYARGQATVRLDDRTVLDKVGERHVETIVPAVGSMCVVLLGEYKGQHATLLEKRRDDQRVIVQLSDDLEVVELDMDYISALSS